MSEHAPGWYRHEGERRYWDGTRWTHATSAAPVVPFIPPPPRKEPAVSLLVSLFFPGVGSMVNGDVGAGVGLLLLYLFGLVLTICLGWAIVGLIGVPIMLLAWVWGMVHAHRGAVDANRRAGYPA